MYHIFAGLWVHVTSIATNETSFCLSCQSVLAQSVPKAGIVTSERAFSSLLWPQAPDLKQIVFSSRMIVNFGRKLTGKWVFTEPLSRKISELILAMIFCTKLFPVNFVVYRIVESTFWNRMKFFQIEISLEFSILQHLYQQYTILYPLPLLRVAKIYIQSVSFLV